jgi:hypothetical protein
MSAAFSLGWKALKWVAAHLRELMEVFE